MVAGAQTANRISWVYNNQGHMPLLFTSTMQHTTQNRVTIIQHRNSVKSFLCDDLRHPSPSLLLLAATACAQQNNPAATEPSATAKEPIGFDSNDYPGDDAPPRAAATLRLRRILAQQSARRTTQQLVKASAKLLSATASASSSSSMAARHRNRSSAADWNAPADILGEKDAAAP